jgi:competence protein ComEA
MKDLSRREMAGVVSLVLVLCLLLAGIGWQRGRPASPPVVFHEAPNVPQNGGTEGSAEVVVHITGAVRKPGVYHLSAGVRGEDALKAAGGATPSADLEALNLAARLEDGTKLEVPLRGKPLPEENSSTSSPSSHSASSPTSRNKPKPKGKINLNRATAAQLETLPGIGAKTAQNILKFRSANGGFRKPEEIMSVKGIGPKKYARLKNFITAP